ncbi:MAG: peptide ABC transporter substrate-binding protein [Treponema sp.]|jgi:oligopeptide transport system substrate-binding protein|nr:peptide ABC transporter substrate-binding protein [Treponema sp.]
MKKVSMLLAATAVLLALALTGCGGKKAAAKGAELVLNNGAEPQSLDPSQIQGVPENRIYTALFEGLVDYDPKTCNAVPGVAKSWERSKDNTVITYHLRDAQWSDGTPITAQTFVDSWLYYLAPSTAAVYAYMPAMIIKGAADYNAGKADASTVGIRAVDDHTFEVTLVGPVPYAVDMMAHYSFGPLPLQAIKKYGKDWTKPGNFVGNGPFILESWTPQEKITVVPNDKYWNKGNVFLSRITFLPIENDTTAYNKYKNGELDWTTNVPTEMLDEAKLRSDFHVAPQLASYYYEFNVNDPVLKDVRIRKALAISIDRQTLVDKVTKGGQIAADAFVPPMPGFTPAKGNAYNVEEAKKLLADAGYPDGKNFPVMTVIYNTNEGHKKIAEYVQQEWKKNLGIDVQLQNMEWATFLDKRQANDFQIARAGWVGDYQDPSNFLELCKSDSGNNDGRYNNPDFDALLVKASRMNAGSDRMQVLHDAEEIMMTQDQAYIPFYYYVSLNMIDLDKWDGWYTNTLDIHPYTGMKLKK